MYVTDRKQPTHTMGIPILRGAQGKGRVGRVEADALFREAI